jgi:hypothetical protein
VARGLILPIEDSFSTVLNEAQETRRIQIKPPDRYLLIIIFKLVLDRKPCFSVKKFEIRSPKYEAMTKIEMLQ